jgi:hypothetical protein
MKHVSRVFFVAFLFGTCAGERFLGQKPAGDLALDTHLQAEEMEVLRNEINTLKARVAAGALQHLLIDRAFLFTH